MIHGLVGKWQRQPWGSERVVKLFAENSRGRASSRAWCEGKNQDQMLQVLLPEAAGESATRGIGVWCWLWPGLSRLGYQTLSFTEDSLSHKQNTRLLLLLPTFLPLCRCSHNPSHAFDASQLLLFTSSALWSFFFIPLASKLEPACLFDSATFRLYAAAQRFGSSSQNSNSRLYLACWPLARRLVSPLLLHAPSSRSPPRASGYRALHDRSLILCAATRRCPCTVVVRPLPPASQLWPAPPPPRKASPFTTRQRACNRATQGPA